MQRDKHVTALRQSPALRGPERPGNGSEANQGVDHDIADERNALRGNPLFQQGGNRIARWREQEISEVVGDDPVVLLRHCPVPAAQPSLYVRQLDPELYGDERRRYGRVYVSVHQDPVGGLTLQHWLQAFHHCSGLLGLRGGADAKIRGRRRDVKLVEETTRHRRIVVLTCMYNEVVDALALTERVEDGRQLHEIRASANDGKNLGNARNSGQCAPRIRATTQTVRKRIPRSLSTVRPAPPAAPRTREEKRKKNKGGGRHHLLKKYPASRERSPARNR